MMDAAHMTSRQTIVKGDGDIREAELGREKRRRLDPAVLRVTTLLNF
jgi:hypothetical protein